MEQTKKEVNQEILFDLFLREKFENNKYDKLCNELKVNGQIIENFTGFKTFLIQFSDLCPYKDYPFKKFAENIDMNEEFGRTKTFVNGRRDYGKEFFDWTKTKAEEMKFPKNTFKTIKEARSVAICLFRKWYWKFNTMEELVNWFEGENDIMLK